MIGKKYSFVSFSIRLLEISTVSVPSKSKRKWARIGRRNLETVIRGISSSSRRGKSFSESVSYSSAYLLNCHFNGAVSTNVTSVTFPPSEVAWTPPLSLLGPTGWSPELKSFPSPPTSPLWWNLVASCRRPVVKPLSYPWLVPPELSFASTDDTSPQTLS